MIAPVELLVACLYMHRSESRHAGEPFRNQEVILPAHDFAGALGVQPDLQLVTKTLKDLCTTGLIRFGYPHATEHRLRDGLQLNVSQQPVLLSPELSDTRNELWGRVASSIHLKPGDLLGSHFSVLSERARHGIEEALKQLGENFKELRCLERLPHGNLRPTIETLTRIASEAGTDGELREIMRSCARQLRIGSALGTEWTRVTPREAALIHRLERDGLIARAALRADLERVRELLAPYGLTARIESIARSDDPAPLSPQSGDRERIAPIRIGTKYTNSSMFGLSSHYLASILRDPDFASEVHDKASESVRGFVERLRDIRQRYEREDVTMKYVVARQDKLLADLIQGLSA